MKLILILTVLLSVVSCSSIKQWTKEVMEPSSPMDEVQEAHKPFEQQRVIPRPGYEGHLTNRVCLKWYGDFCEEESIRKYSLKDEPTRKRFIEFSFACHIGGKRYRVCPDQEGFCRREKENVCEKWGKKLFSRKKVCRKWREVKTEKFISIDDYKFLLDGSTECKKGL